MALVEQKLDRLDNEDIGIIWERHFPKRAESASSMSLCVTLAMIIMQRAKLVTQYSDWSDKLQHALTAARVSKEQFDTVERESNNS
jgi:hypothetical protein